MKAAFASLAMLFLLLIAAKDGKRDIVFADFEGETYGEWKTTGTAFGKGPGAALCLGRWA